MIFRKAQNSQAMKKSKKQATEKNFLPCGILLHTGSGYASLAPVSQTVIACN